MTWLLILLLPIPLFYLGSRALITRWLWSCYPSSLAKFFDCAACSGFWYTLATASLFGWIYDVAVFGLPPHEPASWVIAGLVGIFTTPIGAAHMQAAMESLGTAVE